MNVGRLSYTTSSRINESTTFITSTRATYAGIFPSGRVSCRSVLLLSSLRHHCLLRDLDHLPKRFVLDSTGDTTPETVCYLKSDVEKR